MLELQRKFRDDEITEAELVKLCKPMLVRPSEIKEIVEIVKTKLKRV